MKLYLAKMYMRFMCKHRDWLHINILHRLFNRCYSIRIASGEYNGKR